MKKHLVTILGFFLISCFTFNLSAQTGNTNITNSNIEKDGSILLPEQKINTANNVQFNNAGADYPKWTEFSNKNNGWISIHDNITGTPRAAFGKSIQIKGYNAITRNNVEQAAMAFLNDNAQALNIKTDNLKFVRANEVNNRWYVTFVQTYKGMDVLLSEVKLRIFNNGKVMAFEIEYYNDINVNTTPTLSLNSVIEKAYTGLVYNPKTDKAQANGSLCILPVRGAKDINYHLVYPVDVETREPIGQYISYVNAQTGEVIWRRNLINQASSSMLVTGGVKLTSATDTEKVIPFPNMYVNIGDQKYTTDKNGMVQANILSETSVTASLEGKWSHVGFTPDSINNSVYTSNIKPGDNSKLDWNENSTKYERYLYIYADKMHEYITTLDTNFHAMDFPMRVLILKDTNTIYGVNAFSAGSYIEFTGTSHPEIHFAESPSVLYHEYGHSINSYLYKQEGSPNGMINGSCNEGTADVTAAFVLDNPEIGKGTFTGYLANTQNIRTCKNQSIYPDSISMDTHFNGQILSGAFWDLRELTSIDYARKIAHFVKYGIPDDAEIGMAFSKWFLETLIADDNDGDLSNGTPHSKEIITAFNNHRIGMNLFYTVNFTHIPLPDTKDTVNPYKATFQFKGTPFMGMGLTNVKLLYTTNHLDEYDEVKATEIQPGIYTALISPQRNGTFVKYYITGYDSSSKTNIYFYASTKVSKQFDFLVGYNIALFEDFEQSNDLWTIGDLSDNAKRGKWEIAVPQESRLIIYNNNIMQPGNNHTQEGTQCLVTDHLPEANGSYNSHTVSGRTTVTSKNFVVNNLSDPLVRFYLWYYNLQLYNYQGMKYSSFKIYASSDDGLTWTLLDSIYNPTSEWEKKQYNIKDYIPYTEQGLQTLKFKILADGNAAFITEALVDDFEILTANNNKIVTSVENNEQTVIENGMNIYPNPFSESANIEYNLLAQGFVSVKIYNMLGEEITTLINNEFNTGRISIKWNGLNYKGDKMPAGVYLCKLQSGGRTITQKMILD